MTDNELLLAISNIVQAHTMPIQQSIHDTQEYLENKIDTVQTQLEGKINALDNKIDSVQANLESQIIALDNKIDSVQANLEGQINTLEGQIKHTQILIENDVLPRLQNIESCYTSTYQRYADNVIKLETLQSDVDILKNVVTEHSEVLQRIS